MVLSFWADCIARAMGRSRLVLYLVWVWGFCKGGKRCFSRGGVLHVGDGSGM